jgi:hypothetical protein
MKKYNKTKNCSVYKCKNKKSLHSLIMKCSRLYIPIKVCEKHYKELFKTINVNLTFGQITSTTTNNSYTLPDKKEEIQ